MKKIISSILALLMLLSVLASCSSTAKGETETIATQEGEISTADIVGFEASDHGGRTFNILVSNTDEEEHLTEDGYNTQVVNDAIFTRNLKVEEYFGIDIEVISKPGDWFNMASFNQEITRMVMAGADDYDMVVGVTGVIPASFSTDYYLDVSDMEYIDLEKEWWVKGQYDELQINGKLLGVYGDLNLTLYSEIHAIMFNTQVLDNNHLESPYDLVNTDKWTIEKMLTLAAEAGGEIDGKIGVDPESDIMGMIGTVNPDRAFMTAFDLDLIERNNDGSLSMSSTPSEKFINAYKTLCGAFYGSAYNYLLQVTSDDYSVALNAMAENRVLFLPSYVKWISDPIIRNMEGDYGIVPYPKLDDDQESYRSQVATGATCACFPKTIGDAELSAQVATYMSYLGYDTVIKEYYDEYLGQRLSKSPEMLEMLGLIRETSIISLSTAYASAFAQPILELFEVSYRIHYGYAGQQELTSMYARRYTTYKKELSTLVSNYQ